MKMSKKIFALFVAAVLASTCFAGCSGGDSSNTIKIGSTGPLTGPNSTYGISVKQAAELAVKEINDNGGVNGIKLEFMMEDDVADGSKAKTAYETLMDNGMQVFMGSVTSGASVALNDLIAQDGILQVTPSASQLEAVSVNDNAFRVCFADPDQGVAMANYIYNELKLTKAGIIYNQDDSYSTGIYNKFKERFTELGGTISADTSFSQDTKDFNAQVTNVKSSDAEFLFLPIYAEKVAQILIAANSKDLTIPVLGCDGVDGLLNMLSGENTELANGVSFLTPFLSTNTDEHVQSFVSKYNEAYGTTPDQFAADAYDGIYIIKAALEKANVTDTSLSAKELGDILVPVMTQIEVNGVTGNLKFAANGEPEKDALVVKIVDGQYVAQ